MPTREIRQTKQKEAIRSAFVKANRPLSPEEACSLAQLSVESLSLATVYRNINTMVGDEWLVPVEIPGKTTHYEVAGKSHHHHFHCDDCGKVFDLKGCALPSRPQLPKGFSLKNHEVFLYGTCASCR